MFALARSAPGLLLWQGRRSRLAEDPEGFYRQVTIDAPPCDRRALERAWKAQGTMTAEALRQGIDGFVWELHLAASPWGFRLEDIWRHVLLWHGVEDAAAPIAMARDMAARIPRCRATFVEGEGHFLHFDSARWREILTALAAPPRPQKA